VASFCVRDTQSTERQLGVAVCSATGIGDAGTGRRGAQGRSQARKRHALAIDDQDDDIRLYLGPARSADLLEVVTIVRDDGSELAIHAMKMRPKYRSLLPEG
jgi:hypothetical protein